MAMADSDASSSLVTVRTITCFINLQPSDFGADPPADSPIISRIEQGVNLLQTVQGKLSQAKYTVQTTRIATNPFGEWLVQTPTGVKLSTEEIQLRLQQIDLLLERSGIEFFSLGPASSVHEILDICPTIVASSHRFSCSAVISEHEGNDTITDDSTPLDRAKAAAQTILKIASLGEADEPSFVRNGLGNFRFCAAASCRPFIPFFPGAKSGPAIGSDLGFAIGLENGNIFTDLMKECKSIGQIPTTFRDGFADHVRPIQDICCQANDSWKYLGIDTSLNPSLEPNGSIAAGMELLDELHEFGGPGTLGVAAELTKALQSLPGIERTGYCGLMLPVCEDQRLAELASSQNGRLLRITDLLSISSVCGVGVDTVPVPGDCTAHEITGLILDVAGIASRWNKSLSLRIFPVPGKSSGDWTEFDESPYMVNSRIFSME